MLGERLFLIEFQPLNLSLLSKNRLSPMNSIDLIATNMRSRISRHSIIEALITRLSILSVALILNGALTAVEAPPERMTYQGFLADANGVPIGNTTPANYTIVFRVYDASQGGSSLWSEQQVVTVDKGLFSVILGEGSQFQSESHGSISGAFSGSTADVRWVGITVVELGGAEIAPRLRLLTAPYSFLAQSAVSLKSGGAAFISKEGNNVKINGDLRMTQNGNELVIFPRSDEVIIGNSKDVPTRISGQLNVSAGGRTISINPNDGGHTRFGGPTGGAFIFDGRLNVRENGNWGEFQPLPGSMLMNTSANHWTFRDGTGSDFIINPNDGGHTRFHNSKGAFIFNSFLNIRDRDNSGWWGDIVPQADHLRLHTSGTRFLLKNGEGAEISISPGEGGHPRFRAGENQEWLFYGRNMTVFRGSKWAIMEPGDRGNAKFHTNEDGFRFVDDDSGNFILDPKDPNNNRSTLYTSANGWNFRNNVRDWFIENASDTIVFAQSGSAAPWRFADHDLRVDKDIFARGSQINSDRRLKKNIETVKESVLDRVTQLRPVRFHWNDEADDDEKTVGFIAQEVQSLFPDAISENGDRLAISTSEMAAYTVAGLQEHKRHSDRKLTQLEEENVMLKETLESLLSRVEELEQALR